MKPSVFRSLVIIVLDRRISTMRVKYLEGQKIAYESPRTAYSHSGNLVETREKTAGPDSLPVPVVRVGLRTVQ